MIALLLLALIEPVQSLEEWSLLDAQPLRELVTVRADYRVDRDEPLLLSSVFLPANSQEQQIDRVDVWIPGEARSFSPQWVNGRWQLALPAHLRPSSEQGARRLRVVARQLRSAPEVRLFALGWPQIQRQNASSAPSRTMAIAPHQWLRSATAGWNCVDDSVRDVACVSIDTRPQPLLFSVGARPSTRGDWILTAIVTALMAVLTGFAKTDKTYRWPSFAGALLLASFLSLAMVGARVASWTGALLLTATVCSSLVIYLRKSTPSLMTLAVGLLVIPLEVVLYGSAAVTFALTVLLIAVAFVFARSAPTVSSKTDIA